MAKLIIKIVLLFAILIFVAEASVRTVFRSQFSGLERLDDFYSDAREAAADGPVDIMFIGSSHVFAAIESETVADELEKAWGTRPRVLEIGKGYSTVALHYLGLKRLYEQSPENMHGTIVLIEAPGKIPWYQTWDDQWVDDEWPSLLGPLASAGEVMEFLVRSSNDLRSKAIAAASVPLRIVRFARRIPPNIESKVNDVFIDEKENEVQTDLAAGGEIRTDSAIVARVREAVIEEHSVDHMKVRDNWDASVTNDIVDLVRSNGGEVIFYEMPLSSHEGREYGTQVGKESRKAYQEWAAAKGLTLFEFDNFETTDDDFPDLLHLSASRSPGYSRMVARALAASRRELRVES